MEKSGKTYATVFPDFNELDKPHRFPSFSSQFPK